MISDSISVFKSNPYGRKSLSIADHGYSRFIAPIVPYTQRPYDYVKPYVEKADSIADDGLRKVDSRFPIVKEDTVKIKKAVIDVAFFPFRLAGTSKDYILSTYSGEYQKCGGNGYISGGKAVITTGLVVTSDSLAFLSSILAHKKEQTKEVTREKTKN